MRAWTRVEVQGQGVAVGVCVAVGRHARAVGGEVEAAVVVADAQGGVGARAQQSLDTAGESGLLVAVVVFENAVGVLAAQGEGVGEGVGAAGEGALPAAGGEAACVKGQSTAGRAGAPPGEDLDDAADRVGSVQRRPRSPDDLDALDVVGGEGPEVEGAAGLVHGDAVDEHLDVVGLAAAQEDRGDRAEGAATDHCHARHAPERVGDVLDPGALQLHPLDDRRVGGHGPGRLGPPVRGDHESLQLDGLLGPEGLGWWCEERQCGDGDRQLVDGGGDARLLPAVGVDRGGGAVCNVFHFMSALPPRAEDQGRCRGTGYPHLPVEVL